jgi:hypothetical protein
MKPVCIIGAGWYGCHAAACLKRWGVAFSIHEKASDLFTTASYYNQNRLHQGFHYARSNKTRHLCKKGYRKFMDTYPQFTVKVEPNLYLVSKKSLLDAETYKLIMNELDVSFSETDANVTNTQVALQTEERYINPRLAQTYFRNLLDPYLHLNSTIDDKYLEKHGADFSYVLNCTNNCFNPIPNCLYELTLSGIYECKTNRPPHGYTVVDGSFGSLYPYDTSNNLYTLTHVSYTPLLKASSLDALRDFKPSKQLIRERVQQMEQDMNQYVPTFSDDYVYKDYFLSFKCKPQSSCDERGCYIRQLGNVISVVCGKITGIFKFEEYLDRIIMRT